MDEEIYFKMFTVSSSSNGAYPLTINAGLLRQVCKNGLVIGVPEASLNYKTKHYALALENSTNEFKNKVPLLDEAFEKQIRLISLMNQDEVSLKHFLKLYLIENKDGGMVKILLDNINKLMKMLISSQSDKLENLTQNQMETLSNPLQLASNAPNFDDIFISKHRLFNCYTELFRNRLNVVIEKEGTRIYNILSSIN